MTRTEQLELRALGPSTNKEDDEVCAMITTASRPDP
jgi:hypothetical protein